MKTVRAAKITHAEDPNRINHTSGHMTEVDSPIGPLHISLQSSGDPDHPGNRGARYYTARIHIDDAIIWQGREFTRLEAMKRFTQYETNPEVREASNMYMLQDSVPPSVCAAILQAIAQPFAAWVAEKPLAERTRDARNYARQQNIDYLRRDAARKIEDADQIAAKLEK